jgi:hypothetical protein
MNSLSEIADRYDNAVLGLKIADQRLAADKAGRKGSLLARFIDFVSETDAEKGAAKAQDDFDLIKGETEAQVVERLNTMAMSALAQDIGENNRRSVQNDILQKAASALKAVEDVLSLGQDAHRKLGEAASACSSASSMETMDAITSNKAISVMSHISTSTAKSKLNEARTALDRLSRIMPDRSQTLNVDQPDDFLDLVLDFADFPIDFMSWMNMGKLDAAVERCKEAATKIDAMVAEILAVVNARRIDHDRELSILADIDLPYMTKAVEYVPHSLHFAVPTHLLPGDPHS